MPVQMRTPDFLSIFCRLCRGAAGLPPCEYNYDTMATLSHQSREKIALAVFAGLIVLSLCGFGWYLLVGHSWNVAASNIDDTFGSMDGYTAIVYEGTAVPQTAAEKAAEAAKEEKAAKGAAGSASSDEKRSHELDPAADDDEGEAIRARESGREADERELPEKDAASSAVETEPDASAAAGARSNGTSAKSKPTVTVAEAQKSYEDKKATVFSLDTTDLGSTAKASSSRRAVIASACSA